MKALSYISATGPNPKYAEKLMLYGQFVGSWDVTSKWFGATGELSEATGEWHFDWILGGRGIQDVLFQSGASADRFGTTLRCYDPRLDAWHISWMQPYGGEFVQLVGRKVGGAIVQEGDSSLPGRRERWTFSEITDQSFLWRGEASLDGGASWRLAQEMSAHRRLEA